MKGIRILAIVLLVMCSSCKSQLRLTSVYKETVIPGIRTQQPYMQYAISFEVGEDMVLVFDENKIENENFNGQDLNIGLMTQNHSKTMQSITKAGAYTLLIESIDKTIDINRDKLKLYYKSNGKTQSIEITSFENKEVKLR